MRSIPIFSEENSLFFIDVVRRYLLWLKGLNNKIVYKLSVTTSLMKLSPPVSKAFDSVGVVV